MNKKQFKDLIERAVWTFGQAFLSSLLVNLPGMFGAENLKAAQALAVSAVVGALAAGFSALKTFVKETL